ncbi:MAG TPA: hypothetical protein VFS43_12610 [Polyangiaceae bacterium]|nr:hypothetical protein [Polyangiaceae bacterium]
MGPRAAAPLALVALSAPACAGGGPAAAPAAPPGRVAAEPAASSGRAAAAPAAPPAAGPAGPERGVASRSTLPRLGRLNAYGGVAQIASGAGAIVLAPLGVEIGPAGVGREEIAAAIEGAPAFGCGRCKGFRARLGAVLRVHLAPRARLDPWAGLGAGGQLFALPRQAGTPAPLLGFHHTLQFGLDLGLAPGLRAGAFVTGSLQAHGRPIDKKGIDPAWPLLDASPLELGAGLRAGGLF